LFKRLGMAFLFENLEVYKKAIAFAEKISNLTECFPRGSYYFADHLNRAARISPKGMGVTIRRIG